MSTKEIDDLLNRLPTTPRSLEFRETKTLRLLKDPVVSEGKLIVAPPAKFRREIIRPTESLTVSNGQTLWLVYPAFAEAEKYDLTRGGPVAKMIEAISATFDREQLIAQFEIQGTREPTGYELRLHPKNGPLRRSLMELRLSLSPDLKLTGTQMQMKDGSQTTTTYTGEREIRAKAGLFDYQPLAGMKVSEPLK